MDFKHNRFLASLFDFLTLCGDLMVLNFLWLLCSLPIITIGPSTCALFKVCLKLVEDKSYPVLKNFFLAFKENFKQSLVVGAFCIFEIFVIYADIVYISSVQGTLQKVFIVVTILTMALLLTAITYLNALIAKFNNTLKGHIINAFKLAFVNPIYTMLMWLIMLIPLLMFLFISPQILLSIGWLFILFLISLPVYLCCILLVRIFKKYIIQEEEE